MAKQPTVMVDEDEFATLVARLLSKTWLRNEEHVQRKLTQLVGRKTVWLQRLATAITTTYGVAGYESRWRLRTWLRKQPAFKQAFRRSEKIAVRETIAESIRNPTRDWPVPDIPNAAALASFLCLPSSGGLRWLTLPHMRRDTHVDHYVRRAIRKRSGEERWIEEPRPVLKRVQRILLQHLLNDIPIHDAAHGYVVGRSAATASEPHVGKRIVVRLDLRDFFGSIPLRRVAALFRTAGYSREVSITLARLCTAPAISAVDLPRHSPLLRTRLPQGAPTSPVIANAIAYRMDRRLAGLAAALDVDYTRYADDLIFSGDEQLARRVDRFVTSAAAIAMEEGFDVQFRKTLKMPSGSQQRVLGHTVNVKLQTDRRAYELLKATLTNCVRHGWRSQNRDEVADFRAHVRGRIAHIARYNAVRGERLMRLFAAIDWS